MMYSIPLNKQEVNSSGYEGRLAVEKPPVSFAQRIKGTYHEYAKVLYLAFCFGLLFIGYSVSLSFLTALYPGTTGFIVIFIIFGTSAVTSFAVPYVRRLISSVSCSCNADKWCMITGAFLKLLFILSLLSNIYGLVIAGSVLAGIGASLLWVPQGVYLKSLIQHYDRREKYSKKIGIFYYWYYMAGAVGQGLAQLMLSYSIQLRYIILAASGCSMIAVALFLLCSRSYVECRKHEIIEIVMESSDGSRSVTTGESEIRVSVDISGQPAQASGSGQEEDQKLRHMWWNFLKNPLTLLIMPYLLLQGATTAYAFGMFPALIVDVHQQMAVSMENRFTKTETDTFISYVFLVYCSATAFGSLFWGFFYDRVNNMRIRPVYCLHALLMMAITTLLVLSIYGIGNVPSQFWALGALYGLTETLSNVVINTELSRGGSPSQTSIAFSWYRFCFCVAFIGMVSISAFVLKTPFINGYMPTLVGISLLLALGLVAVICGIHRRNVLSRLTFAIPYTQNSFVKL